MKKKIYFITILLFVWLVGWYSQLPNGVNANVSKTYEDTLYTEYCSYRVKADSILSNYKSRITGDMLADSWIDVKREYNVDVPLELALAQAQLESSFGNSRLAISNNNPYNIVKNGKFARYSTLKQGVTAYYQLMATNYLRCKSREELLNNFTNCRGNRYASSQTYEIALKRQINRYNID